MLSEPEKQELIQLAAAGDRFALQRLLLHYSPPLRHHLDSKIPQLLRRSLSVDDVLQQAFIKAFQSIGTLKHRTPASFYVWIKTVTENHLRDALRYQTRVKRQVAQRNVNDPADNLASSMVQFVEMLSDHGDTPGRFAVRRETIEAVQVGLAGLPGDQREAIRLHYLEGRTLGETAEKMQRTDGAIRGLLQRGKKELRGVLRRSSLWID